MISASTFVPKITIPGFDQINTGITLSSTVFESGVAKFYGVSEKAEALVVGNSTVPAENFLRADQNGTITGSLTIDSEDGIFIGTNSASQILHSDGKLYLKTSTAGEVVIAPGSTPVVTVSSTGKLGLNKSVPVDTLDVVGTASVSQTLNVGDNIIAQGNASIAGDISVSGSATVAGVLVSDTIVPSATNSKNIGSATNVFATVYANSFRGNLIGNVTGAVNGSATTANKLSNTTTFRMTGDVTAAQFTFDGQSGGTVKTFNTVIGAGLIANKTLTATSNNDDQLLINKVSGTNRGLFRITKQSLLGNIPRMPAGIIMPYGGNTAPAGWLFCYGQLLTISSYSELFSAIGYAFKDQGLVPAGKFALPDFRGRSPVGLDNMGGSRAGVIPGTSATELGNIGGAYNAALSISNLPEHEHDMKGSAGTQYYAINDQNSVPPDAGSFRGQGPDDGNDAQYLPSSGGIKTTGLLGQPFSVMNPFVAVNYIIYTGKE
jgi:microcystin-dependent protein